MVVRRQEESAMVHILGGCGRAVAHSCVWLDTVDIGNRTSLGCSESTGYTMNEE